MCCRRQFQRRQSAFLHNGGLQAGDFYRRVNTSADTGFLAETVGADKAAGLRQRVARSNGCCCGGKISGFGSGNKIVRRYAQRAGFFARFGTAAEAAVELAGQFCGRIRAFVSGVSGIISVHSSSCSHYRGVRTGKAQAASAAVPVFRRGIPIFLWTDSDILPSDYNRSRGGGQAKKKVVDNRCIPAVASRIKARGRRNGIRLNKSCGRRGSGTAGRKRGTGRKRCRALTRQSFCGFGGGQG